jgi:hypothetical protein
MTAIEMPRFLIRAGSAGDWMIWDRVTRGAATLDDRKLVRLSRDAAEAALARLLAPGKRSPTRRSVEASHWQVLYGHQVIDCRDETEAKVIARRLLKRRLRISARLVDGKMTLWTVEGRDQLRAWLSR